ncbi:zinc ribbon domain-containing protein [Halorhabdus amylolytica]|uniref:zinc ribbon domain-containing protein n=1 Tax=Halorhabdus amylolytica TaxID=2559573 RepID=UPI0010AB0AC9|nr:zinc ribbon domain-containing protein [Halorhabdus amylolytica]
MIECPYCGADSDEAARFCDRCGERLSDEAEQREGFLRRSSVQYLQGVRHGARPLDPSSAYHEGLCADLAGAVADLSYLAEVETLALSDLIDVDDEDLGALDRDLSPDTDLPETDRRALGLVVLVGLLEDSFEGRTLDELRALGVERAE